MRARPESAEELLEERIAVSSDATLAVCEHRR
jgi:hypothetical protein